MTATERTRAERGRNGGEDLGGLGHAAGAELAAGHLALVRADHERAVGLNGREIAARRRVVPHAHVHCRREKHALVGGEEEGAGEIVRLPAGELRDQVGGGGRDDDEVGAPRELDVAHLGLGGEVEEGAARPFPGEGGDCQGSDELRAASGEDRHDPGAGLLQEADELEGLVGGDATTDDEEYPPATQHPVPGSLRAATGARAI